MRFEGSSRMENPDCSVCEEANMEVAPTGRVRDGMEALGRWRDPGMESWNNVIECFFTQGANIIN